MPWITICLVVALVFCVIQSFLTWWLTPAPRPAPHLGWLGLAFFIATFLLRNGNSGHG
jgi:hypothetical protein